jgi:O-antigen ligase
VNGRAGGGASVNTRDDLYRDTFDIVKRNPQYALLGYGTEQPRTESGTNKEGTRYVPRAGTHSTYLNYLFRTGIPGMLMVLALYIGAGLHARQAGRERDREEALLATLLTASVVTVAAHAVILSLYVEPIYTLVISLVLGAALAGAHNLRGSMWPWKSSGDRSSRNQGRKATAATERA